ncbi:phage tail protein [Ferrimonas aestuarii]|uniref:Prophage minor tail protein Z (GPZ) n=1 Tax=Ferrimonas aestuarii TaxID=2569539 RepID=A0A4U1BLW6_9GAMM|nr:phage tail protein [Ferrimonas aestuarii]TKB53297.1 hypothetical protein FCL42_14590 [Ferrimonas aestuarii]
MATVAYYGKVSVEHNIAEVASTLTDLQRKSIPKATRQGLNRAITSTRGTAVKIISEETGIKQKDVRAELRVSKATSKQKTPSAEIKVYRRTKAINLIEFVTPNRRKPSGGKGKPQYFRRRLKRRTRKGGRSRQVAGPYRHEGVEAKAWRNNKTYRGAFVVRTSQGVIVAKRSGKRRGHLSMVSGPSVKATMVQPHINEAMKRHAKPRFITEFGRALDNDLRRRGLL